MVPEPPVRVTVTEEIVDMKCTLNLKCTVWYSNLVPAVGSSEITPGSASAIAAAASTSPQPTSTFGFGSPGATTPVVLSASKTWFRGKPNDSMRATVPTTSGHA